MASLIKKKKGKRLYYYMVESKRVNGKPRIVNQTYLGPVERVVRILSEYPKRVKPKEVEHLKGNKRASFPTVESFAFKVYSSRAGKHMDVRVELKISSGGVGR